MLPVGRFPQSNYEEVTASVEGWQLLLLIIYLENQGDKRDKEQSELNQFFPCNHAHTPFLSIGGKEEHHPRKDSRETAYRGTTDSTATRIARNSTNCKKKKNKTGHDAQKCGHAPFLRSERDGRLRCPGNKNGRWPVGTADDGNCVAGLAPIEGCRQHL